MSKSFGIGGEGGISGGWKIGHNLIKGVGIGGEIAISGG